MSNKKGFVIDTPDTLITTSAGDLNVLTSSSGEVVFSGDSIQINGGLSLYDLIEIDTKSNIEINLTDTEWKMQSLALTSGGTVTIGSADRSYFGTPYTASSDAITIPYEVVPSSVRINGLTETSGTVATGEFKVTVGTGDTTIDFFAGDFADGTEITPSFKVSVANSETLTVKSSDTPTSGEVVLQFPIYGDESGIAVEAIGQITVYSAKIMRDNTIGGSYKSASTFDLKLRGLDPRRADKNVFKFDYIPVA